MVEGGEWIFMGDERSDERTEATSALSPEELRRLINRLPGVITASVVTDDGADEELSGVNLVARANQRSRGQLRRDVVSLLFIHTGERMAEKDVDVVFSAGSELVAGEGARPQLVSLATTYERGTTSIEVTLAVGDRRGRASRDLESPRPGRIQLLSGSGRVTLSAAEQLISERCHFALEGADTVRLAGEDVAVVAVATAPDVTDGPLIGAVRIHGDLVDAGAKAALDAINRAFSF